MLSECTRSNFSHCFIRNYRVENQFCILTSFSFSISMYYHQCSFLFAFISYQFACTISNINTRRERRRTRRKETFLNCYSILPSNRVLIDQPDKRKVERRKRRRRRRNEKIELERKEEEKDDTSLRNPVIDFCFIFDTYC